jgi:dTDP-4-amino-4,6-dideoxygalactose transaminase
MDPALVEAAITPRTKAILCVHQLGMPCDLSRIVEVGRRRGIPVVEDAACAIGSEVFWDGRWERIGQPHGDVACFSFHPRKVVTTGDGGMVTTNNAEWDQRLRLLRQHGMSVPDTVRHAASRVVYEEYVELGYNYRLTDLQAAVGREQLRRLEGLVSRRRALAAKYAELLKDIPGLELPQEPVWARSNWQSYCVLLPTAVDQTAVMQSLLDRGVSTRRGVMCTHKEAAYPAGTWKAGSGLPTDGSEPLPVSVECHSRGLILPLFDQMTTTDQIHVSGALRAVLGGEQ